MMCNVACLLRCRAGSLSANSDSSGLPTTGSCPNSAELAMTAANANRPVRNLIRGSPGCYQCAKSSAVSDSRVNNRLATREGALLRRRGEVELDVLGDREIVPFREADPSPENNHGYPED